MFVERVTKEQMKMFLETFACCSEQKNLVMRLSYAGKEPYLDVLTMTLTVHIAAIYGTNSCIPSSHTSIIRLTRDILWKRLNVSSPI